MTVTDDFPMNSKTSFSLPTSAPRRARRPRASEQEPVMDFALRLAAEVPDGEKRQLPRDGARNHDHYLYEASLSPM